MKVVEKNYVIKNCFDCPLRTTDGGGPGTVMICGHPHWGIANYDAAIITQANIHGIPDKCPLRNEELKEIKTYKLS